MLKTKEQFFENILIFLLFAYAVLFLPYKSIAKTIFVVYCVLLFLFLLRYRPYIFKTTPFYILVAAVVVGLITWIVVRIQAPEIVPTDLRMNKFFQIFYFIPIAIILYDKKRLVFALWVAVVISAILMPWSAGGGWKEIVSAADGVRTGFGGHMITMGIIYSVIFIASLFVIQNQRISLKTKSFALFVLVFSGFGLYASQTRAIYLGFALEYLFFLLFIIYLSAKDFIIYKKKIFYIAIVLSLLAILFFALLHTGKMDWILKKTTSEQSVFWLLLSGDFDKIPKNASGFRIHFWIDAWQWIVERPLFGWGEKANRAMHAEAGNFFGARHFVTIHNDILELLLSRGVFGLVFVVSVIVWLCRKVFCAYRDRIISADLTLFFVVFLLFFFFNGLFMSLLHFKESNFLWGIVLGGYLALISSNKRVVNKIWI